MEGVINRLMKWFKGGKADPEMVQIYPTNKCNLNCIFCTQRLNIYENSEEMKRAKWFEIVKKICEMDIEKILISGGGEPLCVPDITMGIMNIVKDHGLEGRMITNGTLWTQNLIKETIEIGWDNIIFSLDAANPETHDYLRGKKGAFERTIRNIIRFKELKKKMKRSLPFLELTTVLNVYNYKEIPEIVRLSSRLGIETVNVEPLCINNPETKKLKLTEEQRKFFLEEIIPKAQKLADSFDIKTNFSRIIDVKYIERSGDLKNLILESTTNDFLNLPCYEPWLWPKIEANGEVWPCSSVSLKGNVKDRSFKEIWFGEEFNDFRKRIWNHDLPEDCKNCVLTHLSINNEIRERLRKSI